MNAFAPLMTTLLDLAYALRDTGVPLTIGGGFGLYLKQNHLRQSGERTLLSQLPEPRATNDIDLFLRVDVLASLPTMQHVAQSLGNLGFQVVENAKFFQWQRTIVIGGIEHEVKVDLLVGPLDECRDHLKTDKLPRVRPKGNLQLHAYHTEEAIAIDQESKALPIRGLRGDGSEYATEVFVPQAFTYLMMKLFAFDDRKGDDRKDAGRHHAMDLYRIVAMMTEPEYQRASQLGQKHITDPRVIRARKIVAADFKTLTSLGILRLREHRLYRDDLQTNEFIGVLEELFPRL
jgi:hypothetical protein